MSQPIRDISTPNLTITVAGAATGSKVLGHHIDGSDCEIATTGSETAATAAGKLATAIEAALGSNYSADATDAVVVVSRTDNKPIFGYPYGSDATQTSSSTGGLADTALLLQQTAAGTGKPVNQDSGYAIKASQRADDGSATIIVRAVLTNGHASSSATAAFRIWWHDEALGWYADESFDVVNMEAAAGLDGQAVTKSLAVSSYATRFAIELLGQTSGGPALASLAEFSAWAGVL